METETSTNGGFDFPYLITEGLPKMLGPLSQAQKKKLETWKKRIGQIDQKEKADTLHEQLEDCEARYDDAISLAHGFTRSDEAPTVDGTGLRAIDEIGAALSKATAICQAVEDCMQGDAYNPFVASCMTAVIDQLNNIDQWANASWYAQRILSLRKQLGADA